MKGDKKEREEIPEPSAINNPIFETLKAKIMTQFNDADHKTTSEFLCLLVNLGMTPTEAYESINEVFKKKGWEFVFFNDIEDFWVCDNEMK